MSLDVAGLQDRAAFFRLAHAPTRQRAAATAAAAASAGRSLAGPRRRRPGVWRCRTSPNGQRPTRFRMTSVPLPSPSHVPAIVANLRDCAVGELLPLKPPDAAECLASRSRARAGSDENFSRVPYSWSGHVTVVVCFQNLCAGSEGDCCGSLCVLYEHWKGVFGSANIPLLWATCVGVLIGADKRHSGALAGIDSVAAACRPRAPFFFGRPGPWAAGGRRWQRSTLGGLTSRWWCSAGALRAVRLADCAPGLAGAGWLALVHHPRQHLRLRLHLRPTSATRCSHSEPHPHSHPHPSPSFTSARSRALEHGSRLLSCRSHTAPTIVHDVAALIYIRSLRPKHRLSLDISQTTHGNSPYPARQKSFALQQTAPTVCS